MKDEDKLALIIIVASVVVSAVIGYKIATSDLDPWLKFWLLH